MTTRREMLRWSAIAAGCMIRFPRMAMAADAKMAYGVQLYMVRREVPKDLAGILKTIRSIGYTQIELYPVAYNHPALELKAMVSDAGLGLVSAHFDYVGFEQKIAYAKQLGLTYMVCPMLPAVQWTSLAGFAKAVEDFNRWGGAVRDAGMEFAFHNHCYEFKPMEGSNGWETLMKGTDPKLVKLELDLFWLTQGGQDPSAVMAKYSDRLRLIHLKDRVVGTPQSYDMSIGPRYMTELGKGTIAWPKLIAQARQQGVRYVYLDQDEAKGPVVNSMKESFGYLEGLKA